MCSLCTGQGESFPSTVELDGREITCDDEVLPREQCCIARRKHLTCYSIMFVLSNIPSSLHVTMYNHVCTVQYGETWYISGWTASFSALKSKAISRRISLVCAKQCWNQLVARKEGCQRYRNVFLNSLSWRHCVNIHVLFFTKVNTAKYQAGNWDYRGHRIRFLKPYESNDGFVRDLACSYIDWWTKFCFENVHHILSKLKQDCSSELMGNQITLFTSIFRCCWNVFTYR